MDPRINAMTDTEFLAHIESTKRRRFITITGVIVGTMLLSGIAGLFIPESTHRPDTPPWTDAEWKGINGCATWILVKEKLDAEARGDMFPMAKHSLEELRRWCKGHPEIWRAAR